MSKKRDIELYIVDIFVAIKKIERYVQPFNSSEELLYSELHWDGVIRELELIGEAMKNILKYYNQPIFPSYFRKVINFRNLITHEYFGIDHEEVYNIATKNLKQLYDLKETVLSNNIDISHAITVSIDVAQKQKHTNSVEFLQNFQKELEDARKPL